MDSLSPLIRRLERAAQEAFLAQQSIQAILIARFLRHLQIISIVPTLSAGRTSHRFLDIVKNQIHQLIVAFQGANNCVRRQLAAIASGLADH
jgi:hypothetical protein